MESIGEALRQEREKQGLAFDEVHEATRITTQNLSALEEDRFDSFPNKVYARAFLRDYANYLGLDSAALLEKLEEELKGSAETEPGPVAVSTVRSPSRVFAYAVLVIVLLAGLGAAAYLGWDWLAYEKRHKPAGSIASSRSHVRRQSISPDVSQPVRKPVTKPVVPPVAPPAAVPANKLVVEVTALGNVWTWVKADGVKKIYETVPKGRTLRFEATKRIFVRVGRANAVRVTLNGQPVVFGDKSVAVTKEFTLPKQAPTAPR